MSRMLWCLGVALALVVASASDVGAQAAASISGVVRDSGGGVVPGVTVIVRDDNSGTTFEAVTAADGSYLVPAIRAGSYTVTASLAGFKTAEAKAIRVAPGQPVTVSLVLEVGQLEETVTVQSSSELVNVQTATVAATLNADQLNRMPTPTRNALNAFTFLPGVNTTGTNRDSTINGLPESFLSITLDGVSNNDNFLRSSDSFFASVTPRQDAVEAASVTLAAAGAQAGGGGVTMAFQTRSGGNRFAGSVYNYYRHPSLNSNYYFNEVNHLPKNDIKLYQYGARAGGPIRIPGVYDGRGKAFFFVHYEQLRFPNSFTRTRTVLNSRALDGWFRYECATGVCEVNVLELARNNGHIYQKDPMVMSLLGKIEAAMKTTGTRSAATDPLLDQYVWLSPGKLFEHQPTVRLDYNVTQNHRLGGSFSVITATRDPDYLNSADGRFPGTPNYRLFTSTRPLLSASLRSTLSPTMVNELRGGLTAFYGYSRFGAMSSNGPQTFEDQGGYAIDFDQNIGLTNWYTQLTPSWRRAPTYSLDDTVTWQRGRHSMSFGGSLLVSTAAEYAQQMVPGINLGFNNNQDPAIPLFTTTYFPGASSAQLSDARDLYALLTGRVYSVTGQAALDPKTNKYVAFGPRVREGRISVIGGFFQDSWRVSSALTLTAGLRWDVQTPFSPANDVMSAATLESVCGISGLGPGGMYGKCNFFKPGASGGVKPQFIQLKRGTEGYNTDWNNLAPSVSVAWRPNVQQGFLRRILGDPEQGTLRAGWSVAYERQGMSQFTGMYGANPGSTLSLSRSENTGLVPPGESWPVLLSQKDRLYNQPFPETATFPIAVRENRADDIYAFAPDIQIARAQSWMVGFQRALGLDMAVEIRYLGTRGSNQWSDLNWNGINGDTILANGFFDEFKLAMANLKANNASGVSNRRGSFAYFGPDTGTYPLPIYLAYFNGRSDYTNPAAYTGGSQTWTSTTFAGRLSPANPAPVTAAGDLDGNATRRTNALKAGYPANFFVINPDVDDVVVFDSGAFSDYHALQIELRRRWSQGLSANVNYQYDIESGSAFDGFSFGRTMVRSAGVRHAIKMQWDWTIPVGREHRFGSSLDPILNGILGGWSVNGVGRIQARVYDFGDARLVGMTKDDLQKMFKYYYTKHPDSGITQVWMLPEDVRLNTRRAYSVGTTTLDGYSTSLGAPEGRYIAPANTASCIQLKGGDCGVPRDLMIRAPWFWRFDIGATKRFDLVGRTNIEVRIDILNLFDNVNFYPSASPGSGSSIFQVTSAYTDTSNTYDPGGRLGQIMIRFNW
ncbi:MAG: carboxypeptidase regulatory-like domain-containing protein [Vicinamibacterales bacterium]